MAEFIAGQSMVLNWIYSAGTVSLGGDFRTCTWTPAIETVDTTAGNDAFAYSLPSIKSAKASITLVEQSAGTILNAALDAGVQGTLIIQPEGTATGKRKITMPAFSDGASYDYPYKDVAAISCGFTGNAPYTEGTN